MFISKETFKKVQARANCAFITEVIRDSNEQIKEGQLPFKITSGYDIDNGMMRLRLIDNFGDLSAYTTLSLTNEKALSESFEKFESEVNLILNSYRDGLNAAPQKTTVKTCEACQQKAKSKKVSKKGSTPVSVSDTPSW